MIGEIFWLQLPLATSLVYESLRSACFQCQTCFPSSSTSSSQASSITGVAAITTPGTLKSPAHSNASLDIQLVHVRLHDIFHRIAFEYYLPCSFALSRTWPLCIKALHSTNFCWRCSWSFLASSSSSSLVGFLRFAKSLEGGRYRPQCPITYLALPSVIEGKILFVFTLANGGTTSLPHLMCGRGLLPVTSCPALVRELTLEMKA